jgi:hypothetical protein
MEEGSRPRWWKRVVDQGGGVEGRGGRRNKKISGLIYYLYS